MIWSYHEMNLVETVETMKTIIFVIILVVKAKAIKLFLGIQSKNTRLQTPKDGLLQFQIDWLLGQGRYIKRG